MGAADAATFMKATIRGLKRPPLPAGRYDAGDLGHDGGKGPGAMPWLQAGLARGGNGGVRCKR